MQCIIHMFSCDAPTNLSNITSRIQSNALQFAKKIKICENKATTFKNGLEKDIFGPKQAWIFEIMMKEGSK